MKIDSSLILKPGAVLKVEKIDFNDPKVKRLIEETRKRQYQILRMTPRKWTQRQWDKLWLRITI